MLGPWNFWWWAPTLFHTKTKQVAWSLPGFFGPPLPPFSCRDQLRFLWNRTSWPQKKKMQPLLRKLQRPTLQPTTFEKKTSIQKQSSFEKPHLFWSRFFVQKKLVKLKTCPPYFFGTWTLQPWNRSCGARPLHLPTPSPLAHAAVVPCWSCASDAPSAHAPLDGRTAWRTDGFFELTSLFTWDQWDLPPTK